MERQYERPDWVQNFEKPKNTEIKYIKGNWYLYNREFTWDPVTKQRGKRSNSIIGRITADGLVPSKHRKEGAEEGKAAAAGTENAVKGNPNTERAEKGNAVPEKGNAAHVAAPKTELVLGEVLEAGPFLYLISRTAELRTKLQRVYREHWSTLYSMAMLRAVYACPLSEMQKCFSRTILRLIFPNVSLNRQSIIELLNEYVKFRTYWYIAEDAKDRTLYLMLDAHRMLRDAGEPLPDRAGHPGKAYHLDQLNVLYAFVANDDGTEGMPVYYEINPGCDITRDGFESVCRNLKKAKRLIGIGGREAAEDSFQTQLEEMKLPYIVRLRRGSCGTKESELTGLSTSPAYMVVDGQLIFYTSQHEGDRDSTVFLDLKGLARDDYMLIARKEIREGTDENPWDWEDSADHELPDRYQKGVFGMEEVSEEELAASGERAIGTLTLQTYGLKLSAPKVYQLYLLRQQMEQSLQVFDALLPQDISYLKEDFEEDGWMFLNLMASQIIADTQTHTRKVQKGMAFTPQVLYGRLSGVHCLCLNGRWVIPQIPEDLDALCRKFGFDPTNLASLGIR